MAYSMDLRQRVVAAVEAGESMWSVAKRFSVAHPTVRDWRDRARDGRLAADKPGPEGPTKFTPEDDALMREQVRRKPGITAGELKPMLGVDVSISAVCRRLRKLELRLKKSR